MGYRGDSLTQLAREEPIRRAGGRIRDRVGRDLRDRVRAHTPVAKPPPGAWAEWLRGRKRRPGHLRDSWEIEHLDTGLHYRAVVLTRDPVAPHVEFDTQPHLIMPKQPGGALRYWDRSGRIQFAVVVHHPGTRGQHMMAKAVAEVAVSWQRIGAEEVQQMARTYWG